MAAIVAGLALRLFFILRFPQIAGDTRIYEELAANWLDHGVYGLWLDGRLTPVDIRAPGYPAFIAAVYALLGRTNLAILLAQALLDLGTCVLTAAMAAWLAPRGSRPRIAAAAIWLAALCPFVANYTAVPLTEVLTTFLTTAAFFVLLVAAGTFGTSGFRTPVDSTGVPAPDVPTSFDSSLYFFGGFLAGLGAVVRPETPLLLASTGIVLCFRWWRPADWPQLTRAGIWMALGLALPLLPWGARNYLTLGRWQFLAPRYAELPGEFVPRGFHAWTKTWLVRFRDVYLVLWKFEEEPIPIEDVNPSAFDSPEERARVAALLERYNLDTTATPEMDAEFSALARERTARHPLRTYVEIPFQRSLTCWFTPRTELLPYSGHLWPLAEKWEDDPEDFLITTFFGFLNFLFVGLALAGAWRAFRLARQQIAYDAVRVQVGLWLILAFFLIRTAFLTQIETPEPRYVLVCIPALLALAAQLWTRSEIPA